MTDVGREAGVSFDALLQRLGHVVERLGENAQVRVVGGLEARVEATAGRLTFGAAIVRVVAAIAGGLVMGAGFIPAPWREDRRAVHDQIAHTRVVKVSA